MKKLITFLGIFTTVAILALPVAARNLIAQPDTFIQDAACTQEAKDALYQSFLKNRNTDQAKAYEDAKKYLACPPGETTEASTKIIEYLKKWVNAYEFALKKINFTKAMYGDTKNYPVAYQLGKEILAVEPENVKLLIDMGANGYLVASNAQIAGESLEHAKKALQLLDSGKTVDDWAPLSGKDSAVAYLNYTIGALSLEKDPSTALKHLIKAAQFETPLKKSPFTYAYIAGAYETGPYAKQSDEYKAKYSGKDETPESKLALANINQLVDRMIDGYARAVALAGSDPKFAQQKPVWNDRLIEYYKFVHKSDAGMNELVAGILSKPLPPEPTPLTSLPTPAPASTPASTSGAAQGTGNGTASTKTPAGSKPAGTPKTDRPRNR
jgi:hypothetical protein